MGKKSSPDLQEIVPLEFIQDEKSNKLDFYDSETEEDVSMEKQLDQQYREKTLTKFAPKIVVTARKIKKLFLFFSNFESSLDSRFSSFFAFAF